jgi:hypothetical protein
MGDRWSRSVARSGAFVKRIPQGAPLLIRVNPWHQEACSWIRSSFSICHHWANIYLAHVCILLLRNAFRAFLVIGTILIVATVNPVSAASPRQTNDRCIGASYGGRRDGNRFNSFRLSGGGSIANRDLINLSAELVNADRIVTKSISVNRRPPYKDSRLAMPAVFQLISRNCNGCAISTFWWNYSLRLIASEWEIKSGREVLEKRLLILLKDSRLPRQQTGVAPSNLELLTSPSTGIDVVQCWTDRQSSKTYYGLPLLSEGSGIVPIYSVEQVSKDHQKRSEYRSPHRSRTEDFFEHVYLALLFFAEALLFIGTVISLRWFLLFRGGIKAFLLSSFFCGAVLRYH